MVAYIATKAKKYKKGKTIAVKHIGGIEEIKMSNKYTSTIKDHKSNIKNAKQAIKNARHAKRLAIKKARTECSNTISPQRHVIKLSRLLLKQVKTTAKLDKLNKEV